MILAGVTRQPWMPVFPQLRYFAAIPAAPRVAPANTRSCCRKPRLYPGVFPDQNLKREIDGDAGSGQHQRCAGFRTSKDQQFGGPHFDAHLFCLSAVVNQSEQGDSLRLQDPLEFFHRLVYRVITGHIDDPVAFTKRHRCLLSVSELRKSRIPHRNQIDRHCQPDQCQNESDCDRLHGRTRVYCFVAIQFPDQPDVVPSGQNIYDYSNCDQPCAEPQGKSVRLSCRGPLHDLKLLQEKPEARHHKTKSHQRQTRTNPCEERSLRSQVVAQSSSGSSS